MINNSKSIRNERGFGTIKGIKDINEGTSTGLNHFQMENPGKLFCRWSIDRKLNFDSGRLRKSNAVRY
jgi:hypothetical protein